MPDILDISIEQSSVEVEAAVTDDAGTASLEPENTSILPEDDDAPRDDSELLYPGLAVAPYHSQTTQRHIQWSLLHQPHSPPTGVPAPTVLRRARYILVPFLSIKRQSNMGDDSRSSLTLLKTISVR